MIGIVVSDFICPLSNRLANDDIHSGKRYKSFFRFSDELSSRRLGKIVKSSSPSLFSSMDIVILIY